jgi:poly [ADP-ribose] polymerase
MSALIKKVYLVKFDPIKNNNKFWKAELRSNQDVFCEWGRVGDPGQSKLFVGAGLLFLEKRVAEKKKSGRNGEIAYREVDIIDSDTSKIQTSTISIKSNDLKTIAHQQIKTSTSNKEVRDLIDYMATVNVHNITSFSGNKIKFNYDKNQFQTELGLVGQSTIDKARVTLSSIADCVAGCDYGDNLMEFTRDYFMSIPQDIGRSRLNIKEFWNDLNKVQQQNALLDGLQASLVQSATPARSPTSHIPTVEQVFNVELDVIDDKSIIKEVFDYYHNTKSTMHGCHIYRPKKMWKVRIQKMEDEFDKYGSKIGLVIPGFHGTSSANLMSLLKSGFLVQPPSSAHVSGKLFGSGIYSAPLKRDDGKLIKGAGTKALNYSTNFWGGTSSQRTFIFFVEVAMGKYYTPSARNYQSISYPVKGYDSTWAYGGQSGVMNDEAIVYKENQVNIKYLIEMEK